MKNAVNELRERESNKLFNFRPALFAAFFLVFGIVYGYYRLTRGISVRWLWTLFPVLGIPLLFAKGIENFLLRLTVGLLLLGVFGVGFMAFRAQVYKFQDNPRYDGRADVVGSVETRKEQEGRAYLLLKEVYINGEQVEGRLTVYIPLYLAENTQVGDRLLVHGEVSTQTSLNGEYGFSSSDISKNICYVMTGESCVKTGNARDPFLFVRARLEEVMYAGMEETPAALTLALLTGDVTGVDEGLMDNMRYGGIAHIFAVSGLNIGALYGCCILLFTKTPLQRTPKALRFLSLVGILFFYAGVCGFSASVVRAAITCAVCYFFKLLGSGNDLLNALGVAAILILLISPAELFGVGFQLSFAACLGLFLLMKPTTQVFDELRKGYRKCFPRRYSEEEKEILARGDMLPSTTAEKVWKGATELLSASIAAQVMTLPILLLQFGFVSGWALLLNFFFVPVTDALFTLLLGLSAFCCILPTALSGALLYLPSLLWSTLVLIFEIADFSAFGISGVQLSLLNCVCYYGAILFLTDKLHIPPRLRRVLAGALWGAFFLGLLAYNL